MRVAKGILFILPPPAPPDKRLVSDGVLCVSICDLPIRARSASLGIWSLAFKLCFATSWLSDLGPVTFLWATDSLPVHRETGLSQVLQVPVF